MNPLFNFDEFINESISKEYEKYLKKVVLVKMSTDFSKFGGPKSKRDAALNQNCFDELCIGYSLKENNDNKEVPKNMPIIFYAGCKQEARDFIKDHNISSENLYNEPDDIAISASKVKCSKLFSEYSWQPKTVFNVEDAIAKLKFPVIAKIDDGHSGLGIKIFKTADELKNFKQPFEVEGKERNFDLYSECIDIDREYRTIFLKDKCIIVNERVNSITTNKSMKEKSIDEEVDFVYVVSDMNKIPASFKNKLNEIATEVRKKVNLEVWAVDVATDKNGDLYILEINSAPGLGCEKLVDVYCAVYEDYYKEKLPSTFREELNRKYISQCRKEVYKNHKKEIAKSPWAIDYAGINKKYKYIEY